MEGFENLCDAWSLHVLVNTFAAYGIATVQAGPYDVIRWAENYGKHYPFEGAR